MTRNEGKIRTQKVTIFLTQSFSLFVCLSLKHTHTHIYQRVVAALQKALHTALALLLLFLPPGAAVSGALVAGVDGRTAQTVQVHL